MDNPRFPSRKSLRLPDYDYCQTGMYFVTICTQTREWLFGDIDDGVMVLNALGHLAAACWLGLPGHIPSVKLDHYVIIPNHIHGLLTLRPSEVKPEAASSSSLGHMSICIKAQSHEQQTGSFDLCREHSGSRVITIISCATKQIYNAFGNTFLTTPRVGRKIDFILAR